MHLPNADSIVCYTFTDSTFNRLIQHNTTLNDVNAAPFFPSHLLINKNSIFKAKTEKAHCELVLQKKII